MSASGTFGSGLEGQSFLALGRLGALVSKTVTLKPRPGNPPARILETPAGMLNSIGLENRGADFFLRETLPRMKELGPKVIVNIGGEAIGDFVELAERFCHAGVDALEVNLSCPNVQEGRLYFSTEPRLAEEAMARVKTVADVP
ncbi:MAG: dihydroorotate dehydrogenase, partial [Planctomycetota bacterium]